MLRARCLYVQDGLLARTIYDIIYRVAETTDHGKLNEQIVPLY